MATLTFWHGFGIGLVVGVVATLVALVLVVLWALSDVGQTVGRQMGGD